MHKSYLALILSILLPSMAYSQAAVQVGSSALLMGNYTVVLLPGGNASTSYFLLLTNGNYSATTVNVRNAAQLSKYGITTTLSPSSGIPSFLGYLNFSVSPSTKVGVYQVDLNATGGNPTSYDQVVNVVVFNETILTMINRSINNASYTPPNITSKLVNYTVSTTVPYYPNQTANATANGTAATTTYQTIFTTIASNQTNQSQNVTIKSGSASSTGLVYAIAAVLIIIIFASYLVASIMRKRR